MGAGRGMQQSNTPADQGAPALAQPWGDEGTASASCSPPAPAGCVRPLAGPAPPSPCAPAPCSHASARELCWRWQHKSTGLSGYKCRRAGSARTYLAYASLRRCRSSSCSRCIAAISRWYRSASCACSRAAAAGGSELNTNLREFHISPNSILRYERRWMAPPTPHLEFPLPRLLVRLALQLALVLLAPPLLIRCLRRQPLLLRPPLLLLDLVAGQGQGRAGHFNRTHAPCPQCDASRPPTPTHHHSPWPPPCP